jgi:hypothetical protein
MGVLSKSKSHSCRYCKRFIHFDLSSGGCLINTSQGVDKAPSPTIADRARWLGHDYYTGELDIFFTHLVRMYVVPLCTVVPTSTPWVPAGQPVKACAMDAKADDKTKAHIISFFIN